jgi:hypothetical protein
VSGPSQSVDFEDNMAVLRETIPDQSTEPNRQACTHSKEGVSRINSNTAQQVNAKWHHTPLVPVTDTTTRPIWLYGGLHFPTLFSLFIAVSRFWLIECGMCELMPEGYVLPKFLATSSLKDELAQTFQSGGFGLLPVLQ